MNYSSEFRLYLEECNTEAVRKIWSVVFPDITQPATDYEILIVLHMTRTKTQSLRFRYRAYSHSWLIERDLPSMLPDNLRLRAERIYPRIVEGVGISINTTSSIIKPALSIIQKSMSDAVLECYDDKNTDVSFIKQRMQETRVDTMKKLFGNGLSDHRAP